MSRVIKFKVFDTFNDRIVNEPYCFKNRSYPPVGDDRFDEAPFEYAEDWQDVDDGVWRPCHLMQFTGLSNSDGEELYEDQIVSNALLHGQYCNARIVYELDGFIITNGEHSAYLSSQYKKLKPIGNFWQHAELLKALVV
jgi:hypothetical protein